MGGPLRVADVPRRAADARPRSTPAGRPAAPATPASPAERVQLLQRSAGNRAVAGLLAPPARAAAGPVLQRKLWPYKGADNAALQKIGARVQDAVDTAVLTIAADPTLAAHPQKDASGYLKQWILTYAAFLANPAAVPDFYFARYGYAVETIATHLLASESIAPYAFNFQIAHGHTRPDVVVTGTAGEVAWIDITSEASKGHIFRKQGGGWASRPYVAEACYDMPLPAALAKGGKALDEATLKRIEAASQHAAEQAAFLEVGRQEIAVDIGEALRVKHADKGDALSRADAKSVIVATCKDKLGAGATASLAKSVLILLEKIEVNGQLDKGMSWANWAFTEGTKTQQAKAALIAYGQRLKAPAVESDDEELGD